VFAQGVGGTGAAVFIHGVGGTGAAVFANAAFMLTAPESTSIANRQTDFLLIDSSEGNYGRSL
jgi:hypothetical protein